MSKALAWIKHEISTTLIAVVYFLITFNLVSYSESLFLRGDGIKHTSYIGATIGALFAGKTILIANSLPFLRALSQKPLCYSVTGKFIIYSLVVIGIQLIDQFVHFYFYLHNSAKSFAALAHLIDSPSFWGIQIWVLLLFFMFTVFLELTRTIGTKEMIRLWFAPR